MRDPNRIRPLIQRLENCWIGMPDMRLGQLLFNAAFMMPGRKGGDIFYVEDEKLIEAVEAFANNVSFQPVKEFIGDNPA